MTITTVIIVCHDSTMMHHVIAGDYIVGMVVFGGCNCYWPHLSYDHGDQFVCEALYVSHPLYHRIRWWVYLSPDQVVKIKSQYEVNRIGGRYI